MYSSQSSQSMPMSNMLNNFKTLLKGRKSNKTPTATKKPMLNRVSTALEEPVSNRPSAVRREDIRVIEDHKPIMIAVLGPTGVGKSTFIKSVTEDDSVQVGHELRSETTEIKEWEFTYLGKKIILVDTPGFDDSHRENTEVAEQLLQWLATSCRNGNLFNGIVYIHSIINPRMQGTALQNQRMFEKLCGRGAMGNVILATSFWDQVEDDTGHARETQLKQSQDFWGRMINYGSEVFRLGSRQQNLKIIQRIMDFDVVTLKAQDEMVYQKLDSSQTSAAEVVRVDLEAERKRHQALKEQMRRDLEAEARQRQEAHRYEMERLRYEAREQSKRMKAERKRQEEEDRRLREQAKKQQKKAQKAEEKRQRDSRKLQALTDEDRQFRMQQMFTPGIDIREFRRMQRYS